MSLRLEFVLRSLTEPTPFRTLCAEYGVSPKTGYKWKQRFFQEGSSGLHDQSRRPAASPAALPEQVVCEIVRLKQAHRTWGPRKIRELYARRHRAQPLPSESSVKRVLDKAGLVEKRRSRRSRDTGRLQSRVDAQAPNDVWTVDFRGWWYTPTHERCEPFTVRDAYSRYVLASAILPDARTETVQQACEGLFERYGLPGTIRSDNGRPFAATTAPLGLSRLSAWWLALGIDLDRIDPGCPYQNGAHERMHGDLARDLERRINGDLARHQAALETWRHTFNDERPHEALGMRCPAEIYSPSSRRYEGTPDQLDYPDDLLDRRVNAAGQIKLHGMAIAISTALRGWNVGLKPRGGREYALYFARLCLGRVDLSTESFHPATNEDLRCDG
ncbi:MAG: integrase core domain-containing protein [Deltaproteobacteria bacterium]|nr:integrase core domain-containing protein [Deltaproteobacteria bacterium]